jgi:hypothetical protein
MDANENRQIARDSLFVMADLRVAGTDGEHRIKMRNLSAGGMMGEGTVRVMRGSAVSVNIRNVGWTDGTIAWVQENRFGIAFRDEIDAAQARMPVREGTGEDVPFQHRGAAPAPPAGPLRKV